MNAALLVLWDGRVFEVYDREESLVKPVARVEVQNLADEFHVLQAMLSPWQSWFFQKRRVLRLVDKVLDHEINLGRLREFRAELDDSLDRKRVTRSEEHTSELQSLMRRSYAVFCLK